jgi:hypothetical protein
MVKEKFTLYFLPFLSHSLMFPACPHFLTASVIILRSSCKDYCQADLMTPFSLFSIYFYRETFSFFYDGGDLTHGLAYILGKCSTTDLYSQYHMKPFKRHFIVITSQSLNSYSSLNFHNAL